MAYDRHLGLQVRPIHNQGGRLRHRIPVTDNLAGWYRYRIGITADANQRISSWADQSGYARDLTQTNANFKPLIGGDGAVQFSGSGRNDNLNTASVTWAQSFPLTIYAAVRQNAWIPGVVIGNRKTGTGAFSVQQTTASPGMGPVSASGTYTDTSIPIGTYGVIALMANGTSSIYQASNGAGTTTNSVIVTSAGSWTGLNVGSTIAGSSISVREVAVYNVAHDANTRLAILRYLAKIASVGGV